MNLENIAEKKYLNGYLFYSFCIVFSFFCMVVYIYQPDAIALMNEAERKAFVNHATNLSMVWVAGVVVMRGRISKLKYNYLKTIDFDENRN